MEHVCPEDPKFRILNPTCSFTRGDPTDLGPSAGRIATGSCGSSVVGRKIADGCCGAWIMGTKTTLDPSNLGICTGKLPWDPGKLKSCSVIMPWILQDPRHLSECCLPVPWWGSGFSTSWWGVGGWGYWDPPLLTRLLDVVARTEKCVQKLVRNHYESISVIFSLRSILKSLQVTNGKIYRYFIPILVHNGWLL